MSPLMISHKAINIFSMGQSHTRLEPYAIDCEW